LYCQSRKSAGFLAYCSAIIAARSA
jgi:hypothetical protein